MKELQGLSRVLDTLVYAYEFITLPTPSEQAEGLEALRRTVLRLHPDLKVRYEIYGFGGARCMEGMVKSSCRCQGADTSCPWQSLVWS